MTIALIRTCEMRVGRRKKLLERECEGVYGIEKKKYDESMDEEPESDVFNGTERPLSTSFPPSRRGEPC